MRRFGFSGGVINSRMGPKMILQEIGITFCDARLVQPPVGSGVPKRRRAGAVQDASRFSGATELERAFGLRSRNCGTAFPIFAVRFVFPQVSAVGRFEIEDFVRRIRTLLANRRSSSTIGASFMAENAETVDLKEFQLHEKDTGSADVQVALLTKRIAQLTEHLKTNAKDHSSRRGLLKMVAQRRSLLDYLNRSKSERYKKVIDKSNLRT